jgi:Kef-type K+ transport system membrane component KefB
MTHSPLLLQLVVILGTARLLSLLLRYLGQPPVIGEMTAGIVLGPIVFGALAPGLHAFVFEPASLPALDGLAQVGLVLFMFIVGAELRAPHGGRQQMVAAGWISIMSVLVPMACGIGAAALLHERFAPAGVAFWTFALFMASAMSITAFPILARILKERGMTHSLIGRLSLTSAAMADVLAWIMLAVVVVLADSGQDWGRFRLMMLGVVLLAAAIFLVGRPLLSRLLARFAHDGRPEGPMLAVLLIGTFACAYATKVLGVHPVFGAFMFGVALPRDDRLLAALIERVEYIAIIVLMPIFFALAGLNTTPAAFVGAGLSALLIVLGAAVAGKVLGGAAGARIAGCSWRTAFAVGSLMNARALMELIVMKVGLDAGVIGPDLFTMLMVMAILTTFMTGPLLTLFVGKGGGQEADSADTVARP